MIPWWTVDFSEQQALDLANTLRERNVSQGVVTAKLETTLKNIFSVEDCVCVSSGTSALIVSMIDAGVEAGKEVIVPNRTWIATAHAARLLGAKVVVCDTLNNAPSMNVEHLDRLINEKTAAVVPVYLNGRQVPQMEYLRELTHKHSIALIEDAAQAIGSKDTNGKQLGTSGLYGCFSLSIAKLIGSGQGGFILTNDLKVSKRLRSIRTHGVESTKEPEIWEGLGGNFRYTDLAASLVFEQIEKLEERITKCKDIYNMYLIGLSGCKEMQAIEVDINSGEVPVYVEYKVERRDEFQKYMNSVGIETRKFYPDIASALYLGKKNLDLPRSDFESKGIYLPSGPDIKIKDVEIVIQKIVDFFR
jgi:perosamine synthetase